ncbi:MAG: phospholipid carrier-dependent glycosyltransferase [Candidatus Binatia bacterium]
MPRNLAEEVAGARRPEPAAVSGPADRPAKSQLRTLVPPPDPSGRRLPRWLIWTGTAAIVLSYFCLLGHFPLNEPDEPRYAEIAREMIQRGDWVTPHLNYVKYFEKPPLIYWLTAANFTLFGMSELVTRLWPALFGLLGIVMTYAIGRAMYGAWTGYVGAALLAATPLYFGLSQILILDMPLAALITVALGAFWFAQHDPRRRRRFVVLLYGATALAVLAKGPVAALLTGGIIIAFLLLRGDRAALRWVISAPGIGLFLVIVLPWFVLVSHRNPEFIDFFLVNQHLDRFLRPAEHRQPLWFFLPIVLAGMLPWSACCVLAPGIMRRFFVRLMQRRLSAAAVYCVVWSAVVFVFFSLSGSKLATYILPMFCPLAILGARFFRHVVASRHTALLRRCGVMFLVVAGGAVLGGAITSALVAHWRVELIVPRLYAGAAVLAAAGGLSLLLLRQAACTGRTQRSLAVLVLGILALQVVAISGRGVAAEYRSLGLAIRQQAGPADEVVLYHHYTQGITYYADGAPS